MNDITGAEPLAATRRHHIQPAAQRRSATLSRRELRRIVADMLG